MADSPYSDSAVVLTSDGNVFGTLERVSKRESAEAMLLVNHDGRMVQIPHSMIDDQRSTPDELVLAARFQPSGDQAQTTIPLHAEELSVDVIEQDQGRVLIQKSVEHVPVQEDVELAMDVVEVERIPSGEEFDEPPENRQEGDTLIIPVVEEVLILTRRYKVVEEVRVTRHREVRTESVQTELRREVITFHEEDEGGTPVES